MTTTGADSYLVIGGDGFLGACIVRALLKRGETSVSILDIAQTQKFDKSVRISVGDITNENDVLNAVQASGTSCIIHTASPVHGLPDDIYERVNVQGTRIIISVAQKCGVKKLVFTSSSGVVWSAKDILNADESMPIPQKGYDAYHETKANSEKDVLAANGKNGLLTVSLRPCGMFGPEDRQIMHRLDDVYKKKQTHIQIGNNTNYIDRVYVDNVALAHLLAADKLSQPGSGVAGETFFITNGEPMLSWDFTRAVYIQMGADPKQKITKIPKGFAMFMATLAEWWCKVFGGHTEFTRFNIQFSTVAQTYNIRKAEKLLGYRPQVGMEAGIKAMVDWWKEKEMNLKS